VGITAEYEEIYLTKLARIREECSAVQTNRQTNRQTTVLLKWIYFELN